MWVRFMYGAHSYEDAYELSGSVKTVRLLDEWSWLTFQKLILWNDLVNLSRQMYVSAKGI